MNTTKLNTAIYPQDAIRAMHEAGQIAINEIDRWLCAKIAQFPDDREMQRMFRRDAIDYEELCESPNALDGKLFYSLDTASRDEFMKIAEKVCYILKPRCRQWAELSDLRDALMPPDADDEDAFEAWTEGKVVIRFVSKYGTIDAEAAIGIGAEEIQLLDECVKDIMDVTRENYGESYRYD